MAPFARDLGYDGSPFIWAEEERRHLRARLDALYFHLYGLSREDAEYVLSNLPHRPTRRRGRIRKIPHPRYDAGLHERPRRGGYRDSGGACRQFRTPSNRCEGNLQFVTTYVYFQLIMYISV